MSSPARPTPRDPARRPDAQNKKPPERSGGSFRCWVPFCGGCRRGNDLPAEVDVRASPPPAPSPATATPPNASPPAVSPSASAPSGLRGGGARGQCKTGDTGKAQSVSADRAETIDHDHGHGGTYRYDAASQTAGHRLQARPRRSRRGIDSFRHLLSPPPFCRSPRLVSRNARCSSSNVERRTFSTTLVRQLGSMLRLSPVMAPMPSRTCCNHNCGTSGSGQFHDDPGAAIINPSLQERIMDGDRSDLPDAPLSGPSVPYTCRGDAQAVGNRRPPNHGLNDRQDGLALDDARHYELGGAPPSKEGRCPKSIATF